MYKAIYCMAKKFKDYYNKKTAELIAGKIRQISPRFDVKKFVALVTYRVRGKEFLARQEVFVDAFEECLGEHYTRNISLFKKILGPPLKTETGMFTEGYWL